MPYTLAKAFVWLILAGVLGIVVGWLLRNATARRQIARARNERGDAAEIDRLRARSEQLDIVSSERDRLAAELVACRNERDRLTGASSDGPTGAAPDHPVDDPPAATSGGSNGDRADGPDLDANGTGGRVVEGAEAVLGRPIVADDLKAIEGIGPKVEELCHGIGIRTWTDMASTEVSLLRTMLTDAGARYKVHDPSTWPEQAELLAAGRWTELQELTGRIQGGTESS